MSDIYPKEFARCGRHTIDGQCFRHGDPVKHLGPRISMGIVPQSLLFMTRCGLTTKSDGPFYYTTGDDDIWCIGCLEQGLVPHTVEEF